MLGRVHSFFSEQLAGFGWPGVSNACDLAAAALACDDELVRAGDCKGGQLQDAKVLYCPQHEICDHLHKPHLDASLAMAA